MRMALRLVLLLGAVLAMLAAGGAWWGYGRLKASLPVLDGERHLDGRSVDRDPCDAIGDLLHEDSLAEAQVRRHGLPSIRRDREAIGEHAQRVAAPPTRSHEHPKDVEGRHEAGTSTSCSVWPWYS